MSDRTAARVDALVLRWTAHLVRDLPSVVAEDRVAEITSDLWEQRDAQRRSGRGRNPSVLLRALRGIPADLLWRRAARANAGPDASTRAWSDRSRGTTMSKKQHAAAKPWVHLTDDEKPFDQTNGIVDFDPREDRDGTDVEADLLAKGIASNIINQGFFGGGGV